MLTVTRPTNSLVEGDRADLLCFNSLLPFLADLLERGAFRDFSTAEELFAVCPQPGQRAVPIHWDPKFKDKPFFQSKTAKGDGNIELASAFHRRMSFVGKRAGFRNPPTQHDWRAESLVKTDKHYSSAVRMKQGVHRNPSTFNQFHDSSFSQVDGQAVFLDNERRDMGEIFRELSMP